MRRSYVPRALYAGVRFIMNQRDLIEMHTHLMNRGWEIQASEPEDVWLYIFTNNIGQDIYKIELQSHNNAYIVVTTKNLEECKDLTSSFTSYEQSLYGMEDVCNRIENKI